MNEISFALEVKSRVLGLDPCEKVLTSQNEVDILPLVEKTIKLYKEVIDMKKIIIISTLFFFSQAYGLVNMENAGFTESYTDINVKNSPLKVIRTYDSRSIYNGLFGFGWCSNLETSLEKVSSDKVIVKTCGAGLQTVFRLKKKGATKEYVAEGSLSDKIILQRGEFVRTFRKGEKQWFSASTGALTRWSERVGKSMDFTYRDNRLIRVQDHRGHSLNFTRKNQDLVIQYNKNSKIKSSYRFKKSDLIKTTDQWNNTYNHKYSSVHNMTEIRSSKGVKKLRYNSKDRVTSFSHEDGCIEKYTYKEMGTAKKRTGHKSQIIKTCKNKIVNKSSFEFVYKYKNNRPYSHSIKSNIQGYEKVVTLHPTIGSPSSVLENGVLTKFSYNKKGQILKKTSLLEEHKFWYNGCNKVARMTSSYYKIKPVKAKKAERSFATLDIKKTRGNRLKRVNTNFKYQKATCYLRNVENSQGKNISIIYKDSKIHELFDQSLKRLKISYNKKTGQISRLSVKGIGSVDISFLDGKAQIVAGKQTKIIVANQIGDMFNNFLSVIKPVQETSI